MRTGRTTRCCSAVALTLACSAAAGCATRAPTTTTRPFPLPSGHAAKPHEGSLPLFPLQLQWTLALNTQLAAGVAPAFDGARAFFSIEGDRIVAYDLARGERLWIATTSTTLTPAASPDLLFVADRDHLVALRIADGSPAWQRPFSEALAVPLVYDNGWLVAVTLQGDVLAMRAADGTLVWRQPIGSPAHARPTLAADRVYVPTEDGRIVALRVDAGATAWERRVGGAASDILAVGDRVYTGSKDNFFYCLRADDGEQDWQWRTGGDVIGLPVVDERAVYFVSLDNVLWALNRSNGNQRWKRTLPLRPTSGPLRAGHALLVSGFAAKLPAFKIEDGTPAGDVTLAGELAAPPHIVAVPNALGSLVVVATRDIVKGVTVAALTPSMEPPIGPVEVLPNPVTFGAPPKPPTTR